VTTVATQALYLMNDPFVRRQSLALAERLVGQAGLDDAGRAALAYRLTLGRSPTPAESERALGYLADYEVAARAAPEASPEAAGSPTVAVASASKEPEATDKEKPRPAVPVNPDEVIPEDGPVVEEVDRAGDPRTAAWASFCQALLGSAEFRYVK